MAKKNKKKNKRGGGTKILGEVSTTLISILVGAIVESLIERLLQQTSSHNIDDNKDSDRHHSNKTLESGNLDRDRPQERHATNHNLIKNVVSRLVNNVGQVKLTRKELLDIVSPFVKESTFTLNDVVATLKNGTRRAVQSPINSVVANEAEMIFPGVTETLKNVTSTIALNDTNNIADNNGKKKNKKKKKKKS
jgi:hypothetical protein